jgi:hypothetical protein
MYRDILNNNDMEKFADMGGEWAFENNTIVNPTKSKAICLRKARLTEPLNYSLRDIVIPEVSSYKYLRISLRSDLSWADQVRKKGLEGAFFYSAYS